VFSAEQFLCSNGLSINKRFRDLYSVTGHLVLVLVLHSGAVTVSSTGVYTSFKGMTTATLNLNLSRYVKIVGQKKNGPGPFFSGTQCRCDGFTLEAKR
jgi:hypothetical protein